MQEVHPTIVISVPRLYEKVYARILERALAGPWLKRQLFFAAKRAGLAHTRTLLSGRQPSVFLRLAAATAQHLVFSRLRAPLGGKLRFFISGGAPLAKEIAEFFLAAGLPIYEGYGLTETSPVLSANFPGKHRPGTVGRPLANTTIRIAADGEILARGPGIFSGYWNDPDRTAAAFTDGWFQTGDIGEFDPDGFLVITDRKKDLIVTAGGENVAPQNLEGLFKGDKFIASSMVYGDRKPFLTALVVPNFDNLEKFARRHEIVFLNHCDLVNHPKILALMRSRIDLLQQDLPAFQKIRRFTLLSRDFCGDEVTPTMKLRRRIISEKFHQVLEGMYQPQGHGIHDTGFCVVDDHSASGAGRPRN
jgi:long-chain acyl-CoA synthetase